MFRECSGCNIKIFGMGHTTDITWLGIEPEAFMCGILTLLAQSHILIHTGKCKETLG
jgi:hypothetical protein